jgi:hypothetical protein
MFNATIIIEEMTNYLKKFAYNVKFAFGGVTMIEQIIKLRDEGLSFRKIAAQLDSTVGKVQYKWNKHIKEQDVDILAKSAEKKSKRKSKAIGVSTANLHVKHEPSYSMESNMFFTLINEETGLLYWVISELRKSVLEKYYSVSFGQFKPIVRVYDVTHTLFNGHNARIYWDFYVEDRNHWHVSGLKSGRSYLADYGMIFENGSFIPLIRSNPIQTPRDDFSQCNILSQDIDDWKLGKGEKPNWIEHVSTYSYYHRGSN